MIFRQQPPPPLHWKCHDYSILRTDPSHDDIPSLLYLVFFLEITWYPICIYAQKKVDNRAEGNSLIINPSSFLFFLVMMKS